MATDAIRGAGRPEATHLIEVMIDQLAAELGHGPAGAPAQELHPARRTSRPRSRSALVYDSGNYARPLDKLLSSTSTSARVRGARQAELRAKGIYRGIGFCTYMEICGLAPSRVVGPSGVGLQAGF